MNRLRLSGDQNRIDELLKSVKGKDSVLDFNRIIPMPESLNIEAGSRTERGLKAYKDFIYVYTFAGTEQKDLLTEKFPDVEMNYCWADEDLGVNTGMAEFENGEVTFDEFYNAHSRDAYELAAYLWNLELEEEGYVFDVKAGTYEWQDTDTTESPTMN